MKICIFARSNLLSTASGVYHSTMLLEGSWPTGSAPKSGRSLDDAIDARFEWIDEAAAYWAEQLAPVPDRSDADGFPAVSPHWLNTLALRYYLVKLIRVVAYFTDIEPLGHGDIVKFVGVRGRDEDYADLFEQLCGNARAGYRVRMVDHRVAPESPFPPNGPIRRALGRMSHWLGPRPGHSTSERRVVLCGNPKVLDPVCRELISRRSQVWWLYDRFAPKSWLRWRWSGAGQLVCDSSLGERNRLVDHPSERIDCHGVDLADSIGRWIIKRLQTLGPRQTRILERIDAHFDRVRPHALVLDEDATPFARAAVALARRYEVRSHVVQHGAPCCRFGFAPSAADEVLVWGLSSQRQLTQWSVPSERIQVTGSPHHDDLIRRLSKIRESLAERPASDAESRPFRVLLLTTVPPRDERPDSVALHLTRAAYTEMLRTAATTIAQIPDAQLTVKLHPRVDDDPLVRQMLAEHPSLESRIVSTGSLEKYVAQTDCVLNCASSAGVEATLAGVPVIQLHAPGTGGVLPHQQWGMLGTARTESQLKQLVTQVQAGTQGPSAPDPNVFANLNASAAARIAQTVLADTAQIPEPEKSGEPPAAA